MVEESSLVATKEQTPTKLSLRFRSVGGFNEDEIVTIVWNSAQRKIETRHVPTCGGSKGQT